MKFVILAFLVTLACAFATPIGEVQSDSDGVCFVSNQWNNTFYAFDGAHGMYFEL